MCTLCSVTAPFFAWLFLFPHPSQDDPEAVRGAFCTVVDKTILARDVTVVRIFSSECE